MRLIDRDTPPIELRFGSCTIDVKALSHEELTSLRELHLAPGHKDSVAFRRACFQACIVGWSGLRTGAGNEVPFDKASAGAVGLLLPDDAAVRVLAAVRTNSDKVEEASGN